MVESFLADHLLVYIKKEIDKDFTAEMMVNLKDRRHNSKKIQSLFCTCLYIAKYNTFVFRRNVIFKYDFIDM